MFKVTIEHITAAGEEPANVDAVTARNEDLGWALRNALAGFQKPRTDAVVATAILELLCCGGIPDSINDEHSVLLEAFGDAAEAVLEFWKRTDIKYKKGTAADEISRRLARGGRKF